MRHSLLGIVLLSALACRPDPGISYYDDQEMFRLDAGSQSNDPERTNAAHAC